MTIRQLVAIFALSGALAFCGLPTSPGPGDTAPLVRALETQSYEFWYAASDSVRADWQEAYHTWATGALQVSVPRIRYNKYRSRGHMASLIGVGDTNAYASPDRFEIHTIWPEDNQVVHPIPPSGAALAPSGRMDSPSRSRPIRRPGTSHPAGAGCLSTRSRRCSALRG